MKIEIKNRFTGDVQFTAEIDCGDNDERAVKLGLAVKWAIGNGAYLGGAYLGGANLRGANLRDADLGDADLGDAPNVHNIHTKVLQSASADGAFDMRDWGVSDGHCGTTMCRAGHVVSVAGAAGLELSKEIGVPSAALAIYAASDPDYFSRDGIPDFYCDNETALADMRRLADMESGQ